MTYSTGMILFGHGARDPEWAGPMRQVQARMLVEVPDLLVELGFLEFMEPDLDAAVTRLVDAGVARVLVLPMFLAQGGHLKRDLPLRVEAVRARHSGIEIQLLPAIGEAEGVLAAMAAHAIRLSGAARG